MISITNLHELEKILRNVLAKQAQLNKNRVLNALSIRGQDLVKYLDSLISVSIDADDTLLIFELHTDDNENCVDDIEEDESITKYMSFKLSVIIYGNNSINLANILTSRLQTSKVLYDTKEQGVLITDVSTSLSINEIINESIWQRTDFDIYVSCQMNIAQVDEFNEYENVNNLISYDTN